jgi:hypothetical protein
LAVLSGARNHLVQNLSREPGLADEFGGVFRFELCWIVHLPPAFRISRLMAWLLQFTSDYNPVFPFPVRSFLNSAMDVGRPQSRGDSFGNYQFSVNQFVHVKD